MREPREYTRPDTLEAVGRLEGIRVSTRMPSVDKVFGRDRSGRPDRPYGIHVPSVVLFGGVRGSGKSTLLVAMAASMENKPTYIATEQSREEVRTAAEDLGLLPKLREMPLYRANELSVAIHCMRTARRRVVIVDSFNKLIDSEGGTKDKLAMQHRCLDALIAEAEEHERAIILVSHMNKDGDFVGLEEFQHDVSAVFLLKREGPKGRVLVSDKNRFGDISERAYFEMCESGLRPIDPPSDDEDDDDADESSYRKPRRKRQES